jgi:hypothetical protein
MEIPKANNTLIDSLATAASIISPLEDYEASCFTMDLLYKPSMTKHVSNWKVFEGDERIINFLTNQENFKDMSIDDEIFQKKLVETNPHEQRDETDQSTNKPRFHMIPKGVANFT